MNQVDVEDMTGFYNPEKRLAEKICPVVLKDIKRHNLAPNIGIIFLLFIDIGLGLHLLLSVKNRTEFVVILILFAGAFCFTVFIVRQIINRGELREKISAGQFEVMDCHIYEIDDQQNVTHGEMTKIVNKAGQICSREFLADMSTIRERRKTNLDCYLIKCRYGKTDFYALISEMQL